jgi:tetratricopeptide (TPR) repeat protein
MLGDSWVDELRADRTAQVVDYLRKELQTPDLHPSNYYSLGAVYMWSGDYRSALAHFDEQILAALPRNAPSDSTFGMAGAAAWCLGDEKLAIKYWRKGTTAGYAVGGANTRTDLLLYAASLLSPATFPVESAEQLLIKKANHWRVKNWPGPIAQYIQELRLSKKPDRRLLIARATLLSQITCHGNSISTNCSRLLRPLGRNWAHWKGDSKTWLT